MKLFGWKSAGRGSLRPVQTRARGPQVALDRPYWARSGAVSLGTWPTGYEAQLREGYLHNAIAQRAVRLVAEGVASVPLTSPDPGVLALVKATSGGQHLLETVASHLLLHGNAYIEIIAGSDGAPAELYALRPERVAVEADTRVSLIEGCDKTIATCSGRFTNALNFHGEPYLPGNDLLTRYPGAG